MPLYDKRLGNAPALIRAEVTATPAGADLKKKEKRDSCFPGIGLFMGVFDI